MLATPSVPSARFTASGRRPVRCRGVRPGHHVCDSGPPGTAPVDKKLTHDLAPGRVAGPRIRRTRTGCTGRLPSGTAVACPDVCFRRHGPSRRPHGCDFVLPAVAGRFRSRRLFGPARRYPRRCCSECPVLPASRGVTTRDPSWCCPRRPCPGGGGEPQTESRPITCSIRIDRAASPGAT
jgi:hypothetical protein